MVAQQAGPHSSTARLVAVGRAECAAPGAEADTQPHIDIGHGKTRITLGWVMRSNWSHIAGIRRLRH